MLLRKRLSVVALTALAVLVAPAASRADTQILVQETDGHGNVFFTGTFTGSVSGVTTPSFIINSITPFATNTPVAASLTTPFGVETGANFNQSLGRELDVTVTSTGFTNPFGTGSALVTNNASASSGIGGTLANGQNGIAGRNTVSAQTSILIPGTPTTPVATDARPSTGSESPTTTANVSGLPASFSMQETIVIRATPINPGDQIASFQTFGGSASSVVSASPSAVPAPAGLALGLVALPLLGLRRALRRSAA